jgi:Pyridoxamine 5'-phosphate oxidase
VRAQRRRAAIAMTTSERDDFLSSAATCRLATVSPHGSPDVTPLWFYWDRTSLWLFSLVRSRRWANIATDPRVAAVIDDGRRYTELRGVELAGRAVAVGDIPWAGGSHPALSSVVDAFAVKYELAVEGMRDGRHAWLRVDVETAVSWDHRKIPAGPMGRQ